MTERYVFTVDEIAEILHTSSPRIRGFVRRGQLKAFRLGRILIRKEDLASFLEESVGLDITPETPIRLEDQLS